MIQTPLFITPNIRLTAIDPERDAPVESQWTLDPDYARLVTHDSYPHPVSAADLRKQYEESQKKSEETRNELQFAIRPHDGDQLLGFLRVPWIGWSHDSAFLQVHFGNREVLERYGEEALNLALIYLFGELNLYRIVVMLPEYADEYYGLFQQVGFVLEVRQRECVYGQGQFWDRLLFSLLRDEWTDHVEEVIA